MSSPFGVRSPVVLDGGLATRLEAYGCDLSGALWSARVLRDDPGLIRRAHAEFFTAGADVAITASYQASFAAFAAQGVPGAYAERIIRDSVRPALQAREDHGSGWVAASVGPYGAALANGAEYTGDYDLDQGALTDWHRDRWHILADSGADLMACETIPSYAEARALAALLAETPDMPAWISFSCADGTHISDGTPLAECAALFAGREQVVAVGINCTAPRFVDTLIMQLDGTSAPVIVYPNSGRHWDAYGRRWAGASDPEEFGAAAHRWRAAGAALIGGCCDTTPEHIRQIRACVD